MQGKYGFGMASYFYAFRMSSPKLDATGLPNLHLSVCQAGHFDFDAVAFASLPEAGNVLQRAHSASCSGEPHFLGRPSK